jgi:hypothetical protein
MENAHLRFGTLEFTKRSKDTATRVRLYMDRFIGEAAERGENPGRAHLFSVVGNDQEVGAVWAAVATEEPFTVCGATRPEVRISLGKNPRCFRGSITLPAGKRPVRHLVAISNEMADMGSPQNARRTILVNGDPLFVLYRLARRFGLPVVPGWSDWMWKELQKRGKVRQLMGIGCCPIAIHGTKANFLSLISWGLKKSAIRFPDANGPIHWNLPKAVEYLDAQRQARFTEVLESKIHE